MKLLTKVNEARTISHFLLWGKITMLEIEDIFTLESLNKAFYKVSKISKWKESTQRYRSNLLINNVDLLDSLYDRNYQVSKTSDFTICERGKVRDINAPSIRDRLVQKVLCEEVLTPILTRYLIYDNFASLKYRGTSFARKRVEVFLRRYIKEYGSDGYVLQIDIKSFFASIDHEILKKLVREKLYKHNVGESILNLIDYIIDTSSDSDKGLNLGSEVPQILAIFYLTRVDTYIKYAKSVKFYGRYMDDLIILGTDKEFLKELLVGIRIELNKLKLEVNSKKTHITKLRRGFTYLKVKYSIVGNFIIKRPAREKITRERRRLKAYKNLITSGKMSKTDVRNYYTSWRNSIIVHDCNKYKRTLKALDDLFEDCVGISLKVNKSRIKESRREIFSNLVWYN